MQTGLPRKEKKRRRVLKRHEINLEFFKLHETDLRKRFLK